MVPRLDGARIVDDFERYLGLVRGGVAGFIVFGGEVEPLREGIARLQAEASTPLIIASDLEQGLGQQVRGGTIFPPAAAVARAEEESPGIAREVFKCIAREAAYAGINTVFAPVLDVNTNPDNPIISIRAFSESAEVVSALSETMIRTFMENGVQPCGKHFPGHGGTSVDSHLALPLVDKSIAELEACELKPFRAAVSTGVPMIMLGHLSVPAIDPTGTPVSISKEAVRFLREDIGFKGIAVTDAMDMGGLGSFGAEEASLMALEAGVDILLHPEDPERLARELERSGREFDAARVEAFRKSLPSIPSSGLPLPLCESHSRKATKASIVVEGALRPLKNPFAVVLSDGDEDGAAFIEALKMRYPSLGYKFIKDNADDIEVPHGAELIVAVFSRVRAYKGGTPPWMRKALGSFGKKCKSGGKFWRAKPTWRPCRRHAQNMRLVGLRGGTTGSGKYFIDLNYLLDLF